MRPARNNELESTQKRKSSKQHRDSSFKNKPSNSAAEYQKQFINTFYKTGRGPPSSSLDRTAHEQRMTATAEAIENLRKLSDSIKSKILE